MAESFKKEPDSGYQFPLWKALGLRPINDPKRRFFRIVFMLIIALNFFALLMVARGVYSYSTRRAVKQESYGPFFIMGRADTERAAREIAFQEATDLAAELNLYIGEFDIVEARIFDARWDDEKYQANLTLYATNLVSNHSLVVIDDN